MVSRKGIVLGALATLALSVSAPAAVLYSFETGTDGWVGDSITTDTIGATDGTSSLKADLSIPAVSWSLLNIRKNGSNVITQDWVGKTIQLDITTDATNLGVSLLLQGNLNDGAWTAWNNQNSPVDISSPDGSLKTTTVTLDYSAFTDFHGTIDSNSWSEVRLLFRKFSGWGDAEAINTTVYIDNFQLVPEPASLSVLGLGAMGLLARRRRA